MSWQNDLTWSNKKFLTEVWPRIEGFMGGGEIKPVEIIKDNEIAKELDILCGIDIWHTLEGRGARGIASRVQSVSRNWETFTIRLKRDSGAKTEYEKRKEAIETGRFIYPYLTCHAYFDNDNFLGGGIAKTTEIFNKIDFKKVRRTTNATFLYVDFCDVKGIREF